MHLQKLKKFLILIITLLSLKITIYNESLLLYFLYFHYFNKRYNIFCYSSILYLFLNKELLLKNSLFFILFELLTLLLFKNKKMKSKIFLLTFFVYLVLINIFEPMVYNFTRVLNSFIIYLILCTMLIIDLSIFKDKRGVQ